MNKNQLEMKGWGKGREVHKGKNNTRDKGNESRNRTDTRGNNDEYHKNLIRCQRTSNANLEHPNHGNGRTYGRGSK